MRTKLLFVFIACLGLAPVAPVAFAQKTTKKKPHVHDHGHAKLAIATDGAQIGFDLEVPAESIFGFEHAAKTDAEKAAYAAALATLKDKAPELFVLPADLGCKVTEAKVDVALSDGEHGDVDAAYKMACAKPVAGAKVTLGLLTAFPKLKDIKVQVLGATRQGAQTVSSADTGIKL